MGREYLLKIKELLLGRKQIISKSQDITQIEAETNQYRQNNLTKDEIESLLVDATNNFFPKTGKWGFPCFDRPNDLLMSWLPCHLRDDVWLAKMLQRNNNLLDIPFNDILEYVKTSEYFAEKRHEYELIIVEWQIDFMIHGGEQWLVSKEYGGDFIDWDANCDIGFRKGIVDTLTAIGMNLEVIEEGIEQNLEKWLPNKIHRAFHNHFNPFYLFPEIGHASDEHRKNWIKMRTYEYYQEHKQSIDKYGKILPEYLMTEDEIIALRDILYEQNENRLKIINEAESNPSKKLQYRLICEFTHKRKFLD